jgi:hypothetical protein
MSASFLIIDVLLAALVVRYIFPMLDGQMAAVVLTIGVIVVVWRLVRDFG